MDAEEMEVVARETLARLMGEHDAKGDLFNKVCVCFFFIFFFKLTFNLHGTGNIFIFII
jgi:hypothetical protein